MSRRGFSTLSKCPDTLHKTHSSSYYQVPRIGVVLQGDTIWLDLRRKEMVQ
jgi:hypothetical protein